MKIETAEDLALWALEAKEIGTLLDHIEAAERPILKSLGCPTDPAALYAILAGERPAPWPADTAARDRKRARLAMYALYHARAARGYFGPDPAKENPRRAAYHALLAGAFAGDVVIREQDAALGAGRRQTKTRASAAAAKKRKDRASDDRKRTEEGARAYRQRSPYSRAHSTRALAAYLARKLRLKVGTVRGHLATLKIR